MLNPIVYPSAGEFWLNPSLADSYPDLASRKWKSGRLPAHYDCSPGKLLAVSTASELGISLPVYFLSQTLKKRTVKDYYVCRARSLNFPPGSFIKLPSELNIVVAAPELCFLQAAHYLPLNELIKFGYDLCAMYSRDDSSTYGQRRRIPVTTPELISAYLDKADNFYGIKRARKAIHYVVGNSNSPVETRLSILAVLPFHMGGFAITKPVLNYPIKLTPAGANLLGYSELHADLAWPGNSVAAEYNSNVVHLNSAQMTIDSNRQTALSQVGFTSVSITAGNIRDYHSIEKIMLSLRDLLGLRTNITQYNKYAYLRKSLYKYLFR